MNKIVGGLALLVALVLGYMHVHYNSFANDADRINAAVPLSFDASQMIAHLKARSGGKLPEDEKKELDDRMNKRAIACNVFEVVPPAAGVRTIIEPQTNFGGNAQPKPAIAIGLFTTKAEIQHAIGERKCFSDRDSDLTNWAGLQLMSLVLADPPLRPLPAKPVPLVAVKTSGTRYVTAASGAGVILVQSSEGISILDAGNGSLIHAATEGASGRIEGLSPNGRIYAVTHEDRVIFYDAESGDPLAASRACHLIEDCGFHWVDHRSFLTFGENRRSSSIHDLHTGRWATFAATNDPIMAFTALPTAPDTYLALTESTAVRFKFVYFQEEPAVTPDAIKQATQHFKRADRGNLSQDGQLFIHGAESTLYLTNTGTLETQVVDLAPFVFTRSILSVNPDKVILVGHLKDFPDANEFYEYTISNQTFAPIDGTGLVAENLFYLKGLNQLGRLDDDGLHIVAALAAGDAIDRPTFLARVTTDYASHAEQSSQAHVDEQRAVRDAQIASGTSATHMMPGKGGILNESDITTLAGDATVDAVGVLHALGGGNGAVTVSNVPTTLVANGRVIGVQNRTIINHAGSDIVNIHVAAGRHIVLVLSSGEHVTWNLDLESGAHVNAILLSGRGGADVIGQGAIPVVRMGSTVAWATGSPPYEQLSGEVKSWTGKSIGRFQGATEAARFVVGG